MKEERDEALYKQFKQTWKSHPELSYDEVVDLILKSPQPRMWVGFYGVYHRLRRILYNSKNKLTIKAKQGLEQEVLEKYQRLTKQPIFKNASPYFLASFIIAEPSVGFYISAVHAKRIIWRTGKKHRRHAD